MSKFLGLKKLTKENFKLGNEIVIEGEVYVKKQNPLSDEWIRNNIHFIHRDVSFTELIRGIERAHGISGD